MVRILIARVVGFIPVAGLRWVGFVGTTVPMVWEIRSRRPLPGGVTGVEQHEDGWRFRWSTCCLMGVVNVTPDSFSDGGHHASPSAAVVHARRLVEEGAAMIDIGGESTRPGAQPVNADEELRRIIPVIEQLSADGKAIVSVDTRKPSVARAAIAAGAHLVNEVTGLRDPEMIEAVADLGVPAVIVHMRGEPASMQHDPYYADVVGEVVAWLHERAATAIAAGVTSVVLDPGFGFGKTLDHNLTLLRALPLSDRYPVMIGASRKRSIQLLADLEDPRDSDIASIAAHLWAAEHGAAIVRVHEVAGHRQALAVARAIRHP